MKNIIISLFIICTLSLQAQEFKIAVGSGYKKAFKTIIKDYKKTHNSKMEIVYGNMAQIANQAKRSNISFVVGDKEYFANKSALDIVEFVTLGQGSLVLAYSSKIKLNDFKQITSSYIKKIAMPHSKKTIYGKAAKEFLKKSHLEKSVKNKLFMVSTAPQVATYLIANEIDAGFLNLGAYKAHEKKLGGYIKIPQKYYTKISIVAGVLPVCKEHQECKEFLKFLNTKESKAVFKEFGLQ